MAMLRRPGFVGTVRAIVDVDVDQWLVRREEEKKVCLIGIAWTKQDFSAGSGTTFIFILAPDTTLHPAQECTFLVESNAQTLMLGVSKARTSGLIERLASSLTNVISPYPQRHAPNLTALPIAPLRAPLSAALPVAGGIKGSKGGL
jgi:hypothetical protein